MEASLSAVGLVRGHRAVDISGEGFSSTVVLCERAKNQGVRVQVFGRVYQAYNLIDTHTTSHIEMHMQQKLKQNNIMVDQTSTVYDIDYICSNVDLYSARTKWLFLERNDRVHPKQCALHPWGIFDF